MQKFIFLFCTILVLATAAPKPYFRQHYQYQEQSESYKNNELQHKKEEAGKYSKFEDGISDPVERSSFHKSEYQAPKSEDNSNLGINNQGRNNYGLRNGHYQALSSASDSFYGDSTNQNSRLLSSSLHRANSDKLIPVQDISQPISHRKQWSSHSSYSYGHSAQNPATTHENYGSNLRPYNGDVQTSLSQTIAQQNEGQQRRYANGYYGTGGHNSDQDIRRTQQRVKEFGSIDQPEYVASYRPVNRKTNINADAQYEQTLNSGDRYYSQRRLAGTTAHIPYHIPEAVNTQSTDSTAQVTNIANTKQHYMNSQFDIDSSKSVLREDLKPVLSNPPSGSNTQITGVPVIVFPNPDKQVVHYPETRVLNSDDLNISEVPVSTYQNSETKKMTHQTSRDTYVSQNTNSGTEVERIPYLTNPGNLKIARSTTEQSSSYLQNEPTRIRDDSAINEHETEQQINTGNNRRMNIVSTYPTVKTQLIHTEPTEEAISQQTRSLYQSSYSKTNSHTQNQQTINEESEDQKIDTNSEEIPKQINEFVDHSQKKHDDLTQQIQKVSVPSENKSNLGIQQQQNYLHRAYRTQRTEKTEFADIPQTITVKPQIVRTYLTDHQQNLMQHEPTEDLTQQRQHFEINHQTAQDKYHTQRKQNDFIQNNQDNRENEFGQQKDFLARKDYAGVVPNSQNGAQGSSYSSSSSYSKSSSYSTQDQQPKVVFSPIQVGTKSGELQLYQTMQIPTGTSETARRELQQQMRQQLEQKMMELQSQQYSASQSSQVKFSPIHVNSNSGTGEYRVYQTVQLPAGSNDEMRQRIQEQMRQQLQQKLQELMQQQKSQNYQQRSEQPILVRSFGAESIGADCDEQTGGSYFGTNYYPSSTNGDHYGSVRSGSASYHYPGQHNY